MMSRLRPAPRSRAMSCCGMSIAPSWEKYVHVSCGERKAPSWKVRRRASAAPSSGWMSGSVRGKESRRASICAGISRAVSTSPEPAARHEK